MTAEIVLFPDAEAVLVSALGARLDVPVSTRVPNPRPATFVRLSRVGGTRRDRVTDQAMVVFEAWADSDDNAADLGALLRAHVWALADDQVDGIRRVQEVGGLQSFPDPETESPRYQFTVLADLRGVPA